MLKILRSLFIAWVLALGIGAAFAAVDANKASQAELESVKGIGPAMSNKVLEARKAGGFKDWIDLIDRVSGIGRGNAAKFSDAGLTVNGSTYSGAAANTTSAAKPAKAHKATAAASKPL